MAVQSVLDSLHISYERIEMGRVQLIVPLPQDQYTALDAALRYYELSLMGNKKLILVERIKNVITTMIRSKEMVAPLKFTVYLSTSLGYDYTYLSNVFSEVEESTIERFYIVSRIERAKELIVYEGISIKEVAYELGYSSVSHLSLQFKKVTGETPSAFKKLCKSPDFVWKKE